MPGPLAVAECRGHAHPEHGGIGPGRFVGVAPALGPLEAHERKVSGTYLRCNSGIHWDLAVVISAGAFKWDNGNIPGTPEVMANDVILSYGQTYHLNGWTMIPAEDGTRFTNDSTNHGMFVSIDNVSPFQVRRAHRELPPRRRPVSQKGAKA